MNNKTKGVGLNKKITALLLVLMIIMTVIIMIISATSLRDTYYRLYNEKAQDLVKNIANDIDGDWVNEFSKTYDKDSTYEELKMHLNKIKTDFRGIKYLYVFVPGTDSFTYIVEAQNENDDPSIIAEPGVVYDYTYSEYNNLLPDVQAKKASEKVILGPDAGYGRTISAWAPVFDSKGEVAAMVEADYILENLNPQIFTHISKIALVQAVCIILVLILVIICLRKLVIIPLTSLTDLVKSYEHGTLMGDISVLEKNNDEIGSLALSFKDMTVRIEKYIQDLTEVTAEKERIGAELNLATKIQADMLPRIFPHFPDRKEFELFATMNPAKEVGGDFYDYFLIDDDHLGVVMADVSGKGVPAALFMVVAKTLIKNRALTGNFSGPGEVLADINDQLCEGNDADLFVTVWFGILTLSTGELSFSSGGHEYPAVCRNDRGFALEKDKHGPPVATMEGLHFKEHKTVLNKGEILYLYTDGVTEATNADKQLFGEDRMIESLNKYKDESMVDILKDVRKDIDSFVGDAPQFDDITMLGLKYYGND